MIKNSPGVWCRGRARVRGRRTQHRWHHGCPPFPIPILTGWDDSDNSDNNDSDNNESNNNNNNNNNNDNNNDTYDVADNEDVVVIGRTEAKDWKQINDGSWSTRRIIDPIPYMPRNGDGELFGLWILEEDLMEMYDENDDLRYYKVHKWSLPRFG